MTDNLSFFEIVSEVGESFDKVKRIPTYEDVLGLELFAKMFELEPDEWGMLPFSKEDFEAKDEKVLAHARLFVKMLDLAVHMLGPDLEIVEEQMMDLGQMHGRYGVKKEHYAIMGKALDSALQKVLGKRSYTKRAQESWVFIFKFMTDAMMKGADA